MGLHCEGCKRGVWLLSVAEAYILSCLWRRKEEGRGAHTAPLLAPCRTPPNPLPPAPLPGDEWWYLLKVKPAGEPWLRLGGRGRLLGRSRGQTQQKAALQSPIYFTKMAGPLLAHHHRSGRREKKKKRSWCLNLCSERASRCPSRRDCESDPL